MSVSALTISTTPPQNKQTTQKTFVSHLYRDEMEGYVQTKGGGEGHVHKGKEEEGENSFLVCTWPEQTKDIGIFGKKSKLRGILKNLENHLKNDCVLKDMKCKYHEIGCEALVNANTQKRHEKEALSSHLDSAVDELKRIKLSSTSKDKHASLKVQISPTPFA